MDGPSPTSDTNSADFIMINTDNNNPAIEGSPQPPSHQYSAHDQQLENYNEEPNDAIHDYNPFEDPPETSQPYQPEEPQQEQPPPFQEPPPFSQQPQSQPQNQQEQEEPPPFQAPPPFNPNVNNMAGNGINTTPQYAGNGVQQTNEPQYIQPQYIQPQYPTNDQQQNIIALSAPQKETIQFQHNTPKVSATPSETPGNPSKKYK